MSIKKVTPERDENGYWIHPQLAELYDQHENAEVIPSDIWKGWLEGHGIETETVLMDHEITVDHPAWVAYFENGDPTCAEWQPESPANSGGKESWQLLGIFDTEDGPAAGWCRAVNSAAPATA